MGYGLDVRITDDLVKKGRQTMLQQMRSGMTKVGVGLVLALLVCGAGGNAASTSITSESCGNQYHPRMPPAQQINMAAQSIPAGPGQAPVFSPRGRARRPRTAVPAPARAVPAQGSAPLPPDPAFRRRTCARSVGDHGSIPGGAGWARPRPPARDRKSAV